MDDCEDCRNYSYDEDEEVTGCLASFDEDDLAKMQEAGNRTHCPYWCRSNSSDESAKDSEYSTVKYQAIGHLSIEEIAKKAREKLAKRKVSKNGKRL